MSVTSDPPGATWYLDGAYVGTTPDEMPNLEQGTYQVKVKKEGYEEWSGSVNIRSGEKEILAAALKKTRTGPDPGAIWREPTTGMEFVWVPGGCYEMGSTSGDSDEIPVHEVCVDGFFIGRYEVTHGQWKTVMGGNPSYLKRGDTYPVEQVSWGDAKDFIRKLTSMNNSGYTFRLPTEAEWEYACRSGGKDEKYSGGGDASLVAWYNDNSGRSTHPVGTKAPNSLGIHDMSGNVWEWCEDWHDEDYYRQSAKHNPKGPSHGGYRVLRGGSWDNYPRGMRCACRGRYFPVYRVNFIGFRVLLVFPQ